MEDDAPVIYGLEFQARALTSQTAESDAIRFLVGTQSLKFDNQIHIIDFDDENNIISKSVLQHQAGEIWHISASPADKAVLTTCYNKTSESRVVTCGAVWRMPPEWESGSHESPDDPHNSHNPQNLELLCHLDNSSHGNASCSILITAYQQKLKEEVPVSSSIRKWSDDADGMLDCFASPDWNMFWDSSDGIEEYTTSVIGFIKKYIIDDVVPTVTKPFPFQISSSATLEGKGQLKFTAGKWSPHHSCTQLATANDTAIRGWDLRTMSQIYCIENAHGQLVRDLDFNPNKQYYLASCGDDCKVKFWDVRNINEPVKNLEEHSHWVWSVRYNHSHDQLVLTGSSDSRVILSNMVSISSEPFGHLVDDDDLSDGEDNHQDQKTKEPLQDSIISTYEEHEDSVYAVEWSSADPWLFASLSYDGRLVINRVPRALKYHILL
ncbi:EARP-interacting protein homolog [Salvelinus sp. IW2-2015]|uniref:EARP-interacting protein homolog n=1 Tax=Salvelinus sp. IW2-2015 TaxID=2691554 RepID=UPI0038D3F9EF